MPKSGFMKAVVTDRYGAPEVLSLRDVPIPRPTDNEVRIKVHASTVGRTDTATLRAHPFFARAMTGLFRPKMQTLGMDFAGVVDAVGDEDSSFKTGDRVFGLSPDLFGAHAEYLCVPSDGPIALIPADLRFDEAVVGEGAFYAHGTTKLLQEGSCCLIFGASGAIGTAAVQLAKVQGARVVAVVGSQHVELAHSLGADKVINFETEKFTDSTERFDLVFDAVGKTSWFECRPLLKDGAVFAATDLGPAWSNLFLSAWYGAIRSNRVVIPFPQDAPEFIQNLAGLMEAKRFHGVFDKSYPMEEIIEAFHYVETGLKTGIVTISI